MKKGSDGLKSGNNQYNVIICPDCLMLLAELVAVCVSPPDDKQLVLEALRCP
jgi:hypothetical protein